FLTQRRDEMLQFAEKLFFGGQLTPEVEFFNAQQTHTVGAVCADGFAACVYRKIRLDRYRLVIASDRRPVALPFAGQQAGAILFEPPVKVGTSLRVGRNDQCLAKSIDQRLIAATNLAEQTGQAG